MGLNSDQIMKLPIITVYRMLIKNFKYYPSKNRFQLMLAMKEEFRDHKNIQEDRQKFVEQKKARMGLAHILLYREKNQEMIANYSISRGDDDIGMNPRDKDFIYF